MIYKTQNFIKTNKWIFYLLIVSLFNFSCYREETGVQSFEFDGNVTSRLSHQYSGEEIFRGIIFGQGELAGILKFPQDLNVENFLENDSEKLSSFIELREGIIVQLERTNEHYFEDFKQVMASKNHYLIKARLLAIQNDIIEACNSILNQGITPANIPQDYTNQVYTGLEEGKNLNQIAGELLQQLGNSNSTEQGLLCVAAINVVAILNVVALIAVAVVAALALWGNTPNPDHDLNSEKLIENIVTNI